MKRMRYVLKSPNDCTEQELGCFFQMEKAAEQVAERTLLASIKRACLLAFCYDKASLVAIGALKHPNDSYKKRTFKSAQYSHPGDFIYELGYIFTNPSHEERGIASSIVSRLLKNHKSELIFATTRSTNKAMQHLLEKRRFKRCGDSFKSAQGSHKLVLYVRSNRVV